MLNDTFQIPKNITEIKMVALKVKDLNDDEVCLQNGRISFRQSFMVILKGLRTLVIKEVRYTQISKQLKSINYNRAFYRLRQNSG